MAHKRKIICITYVCMERDMIVGKYINTLCVSNLFRHLKYLQWRQTVMKYIKQVWLNHEEHMAQNGQGKEAN